MAQRWMVCSACRKDIPYATTYYACSVSTCNRSATRLVFCSVGCWDSHVAILRHRDAWAVEERAPSAPGGGAPAPVTPPSPPVERGAPNRIVVAPPAPSPPASSASGLQSADDSDILI